MRSPLFLLAVIVAPLVLEAQRLSDADAVDQMKYDVQYLASDRLEGREAGTAGERLAAEYIAQKFGNIGLMPYGDSATYRQAFPFAGVPKLGEANALQLGRKKLKLDNDWSPLPFSASGEVRGTVLKCGYGIHAPDLGYDDYADLDLTGKVAALSISSPDGIHPHSKYLAYHDLRTRADQAAERGAVAVLFYNDDPTAEDPSLRFSDAINAGSVPAIFLKGDRYEKLVVDGNPCALAVEVERPQLTGYNLVGMLDNGREHVVVIGAHYDHLGYGSDGSLHRGEKAIHNGADDNASGVAVMLQLARDLADMDEARANDYLFIAFSGEEKGLYGSNYWTKHPTVPIAQLNYMINLDMVGRLDSAHTLAVNGVGTSPAWKELEHVTLGGMDLRTTESGIGPSDHSAFYMVDVPAIHFFTGTHEDYHKPGDDAEKLNYEGMLEVARFIESLVTDLSDNGKLAFTKTKEDTAATPRFTVTLGVVPDYMYDGKGMRIDGITEGKPASQAGLKPGDVVVRMGQVEVNDMMGYMKALSLFRKGQTTTVVVLRGGEEVESEVTF